MIDSTVRASSERPRDPDRCCYKPVCHMLVTGENQDNTDDDYDDDAYHRSHHLPGCHHQRRHWVIANDMVIHISLIRSGSLRFCTFWLFVIIVITGVVRISIILVVIIVVVAFSRLSVTLATVTTRLSCPSQHSSSRCTMHPRIAGGFDLGDSCHMAGKS